MSLNSIKRIESKKRKAAAFLQLVNSDEDYVESKTKQEDLQKEQSMRDVTASSSSAEPGSGKGSLSDEMFAEYKKMMRERQKASMQRPKVFLTLDELARDDPVQTLLGEVKVPPPLFMADVQHLLLYAMQGIQASIKPRWCRLLRVGKVSKVVAVVLDSVSSDEFKKFPESLPTLEQAFDLHVEMVSPLLYGSSVREDIMNVPLSITQLKKKDLLGHQNVKVKSETTKPKPQLDRQIWAAAKTLRTLVESPLRPLDHISEGLKRKREEEDVTANKKMKVVEKVDYGSIVSTYESDRYDRRWLMLNSAQMISEGIPTPVHANSSRYKDYMFSKEKYGEVTERSPLYAVDCEMIQTKASKMDLARVSIVDENLQVVLDTYVKPWSPVTNYVTPFSGITKEILDPVTVRLEDVQNIIQTYLPPDAILCGQSICNDLASMKLFHPYIIDTSVIYNLTGERRFKTGLKRLSNIFLRRDIQSGHEGHSSVEDAQATMELVLLKLRNSMEFGDILLTTPETVDLIEVDKTVEMTETEVSIESKNDVIDLTVKEDCTTVVETNHSDLPSSEGELKTICTAVKDSETISTQQKIENLCSSTSAEKDFRQSNIEVESDSTKCLCSNQTDNVLSDSPRTAEIQKRKLFFQREGGKFMESFFQRIGKQKRLGAVVDNSVSVPLYPDSAPVTTCKNDKDAERLTLDKIKEVGFCFTHLYGYRDYLEGTKDCSDVDLEKTKACLWKLDRRFWKILTGLPACSLFVVILPGREVPGHVQPAMTFVKIT